MPILSNERHEHVAQLLAKGETQKDAYAKAGYRGNEAKASRVCNRADVKARVAELLERAAARTEVSVATLTGRLLKIADKAESDMLGAPGLSTARAALMDVAKLNGLIIDRTTRELSEEQLKLILDLVAANPGKAQELLAQLS